MRQSKIFSKTRKESPKDETSKNADLLIRGGYIYKEMAGVYNYLPLGFRVLQKIIQVIREEMNQLSAEEVFLASLQEKANWEKTNRWSEEVVDVWFKTKLKNDTELGLAFTHEEAIAKMAADYIYSYRDLPKLLYQFQNKFRNEIRAKSGIMRTREFVMKDLYSFAKNETEHQEIYEKVAKSYERIFAKLGLGEITYKTFASGGTFAKYSHEFQTVSSAGEDTIYVDQKSKIAVNAEVLNAEVLADLNLKRENLIEKRSAEVGNIFSLGTKYAEALNLFFKDEDGKDHPVIMGSYGLGPGRIMGVIAETLSDENGLIWPEIIAPYKIHLLTLGDEKSLKDFGDDLYAKFLARGIEVLYDDRENLSAGHKLKDSDLLGLPYRVIVSSKNQPRGEVGFKKRGEVEEKVLSFEKVFEYVE